MKNKFQFFLYIFFCSFLNINNINANTDFVFEGESIEFLNDGNIVIAKNGVEITYGDDLRILSDQSKYSKISKKLSLIGNVIIIDKKKNLIIKSNKIDYDKNLELILSKEETIININNNYNIKTKNIKYLRSQNIIESNEKTILQDNFTNKLETSSFIYYQDKKEFRSNDLIFTDKYLNRYFSNEAALNLASNEIAAKDIKFYFSKKGGFGENSRIKGNSITYNENFSVIKKGIFTTCKENDTCPPWSLQSEEIKHDKNKKRIEYKNAWLRLYDKPIFYFPKFFHPDPTVKRQSGFLIPSILNSSTTGNSFKIPYYHVLAQNKDLTITPRFYTNADVLIQNEYRQVGKNSNHLTDFSIKKLNDSTKSHIFSNTKMLFQKNFFDTSEVEINLEKTSNDTYLKSDNIKSAINDNQSLMNSFLTYKANKDDLNFFAEISAFEDLTKEKSSDKFQYVLPNLKISKLIDTNDNLKGDLIYSANALNQKRNTNVNESYLINDLEYNSNLNILKSGFVNSFNINYKNISKEGSNSENYSDKFQNDNFFTTILKTSFPTKKETKNYKSTLTPKALLSLSPFDSENISDQDSKINVTNLFSNNRLGLIDSLEGGKSLTFGFDDDVFGRKNNKKFFSASLGQVLRDKDDKKLPLSSTMQNQRSDFIGRLEISPNDNFEINYNFSADNDFDTINYSFAEAKLKVNNFITSFEFLEENNSVGSESYLSNKVGYTFNNSNSLNFNTRRNRKTDLTEYYNLIYEYKNDCLVAAIEYNKDYYEDRDIKPTEEIFFSLTLTPFVSINSPNLD